MIENTITTYSPAHCVAFTVAALAAMTAIVGAAVYDIRKLTGKIGSKISSFDDLLLVQKTINFDMLLVWPALVVVAIYLSTMIFSISRDLIALNVFLNSMTLYMVGTLILGRWSKVNEKKLQTLNAEDPELAGIYKTMLVDWRKRWFRLRPMREYKPDVEKTVTVREISNYTEM
jgi:hypothetical protein